MAIKRITSYGKFTPIGVDESEARKLQALAGVGEKVTEAAVAFGKQKAQKKQRIATEEAQKQQRIAIEEAKLAGAEEGADAPVTGPELRMGGNVGDAQFNATAKIAYASSLERTAKQKVKDAEEAHPNDIQAFNQQAQMSLNAMRKNIAGWAVSGFDDYASKEFNVTFNRVQKTQNKQIENEAKVELVEGFERNFALMTNLAFNGDAKEALEIYNKLKSQLDSAGNLLTATQIQSKRSKLNLGAIKAENSGLLQNILDKDQSFDATLEEAQSFINKYKGVSQDLLSVDDNQKVVSSLEARLKDFVSENNKIKSNLDAEQKAQIFELEKKVDSIHDNEGIHNNADVLDELEDLYDGGSGIISKDKYEGYISKLNTLSAQAEQEISSINKVSTAISEDSDEQIILSQGEVDTYYEKRLQPTLSDNPNERALAQATYIQSTKVVPKAIKRELEQGIYGTDENAMIQAADLVTRLSKIPGMGSNVLDADMLIRVEKYNTLSFYMGHDLAMQKIETDMEIDPDKVAARRKEISDKEFAKKYPNDVSDMFDWYDDSRDFRKDKILKDYTTLVNEYYVSGASLKEAKKIAEEHIKANFKQGEFGVMKYDPLDYYGVMVDGEKSVEWMRDKMYADLTGPFGIAGIQFEKEDIHIFSDNITAREATTTRYPSYLMYINTNAGLVPASVNGNQRYYPDAKAFKKELVEKTEKEKKDKAKLSKGPSVRSLRQRTR